MTALAAIAACLLSISPAHSRQPAETPKLLVIIVVDQFRFEYLDRYAHLWTGGLKRLRSEGAIFEQARYPYLNTVTCAGHATIGTGTYPYRHGVILNEWYQRTPGRRMSCTADPSVSSVPYSPPPEPIGHSAHRLRTPTLGDRLRASSPASRVLTLSMKPRSAVMLGGHGGIVTWFADSNVWGTSTAFSQAPVPEIAAYVADNPVERDRSEVWDRLLPVSSYAGADDRSEERPPRGRKNVFPHPLAGVDGTPPERFFDLWERSPYSDAYLGRMAAALVRALQLGQRDVVDYLGVSFSSLDYVGHDFGPDSHEVQDTLIRLDRTLGALLDALDRTVGTGRYAVGLSSDHGVSRIPEALRAEGLEAGRVVSTEVREAAEAALSAAHGPGPHVAHVEYSNVYLSERARERAAADPKFVQPAIDRFTALPGVERVFRSNELPALRQSADPIERAAALSHHPQESGELTLVLRPNWIGTNTSAATHGSARDYDQHVPVIFLGAPFQPGRYAADASPADIAPTLAALAGISMPDVDGRVRRDAIRRSQ